MPHAEGHPGGQSQTLARNPLGKRAFDFLCALAGLVCVSPLLLILAVLVKLGDGGPVFFVQRRVGKGGVPFAMYKFRSMVLNAEKLGLSVTKDGDPRITCVGRFLRKTKLDELPQLWNVLRGDMSFVGPRPEVPRYVERYTPAQQRVLQLQPGITDLATLEFRNEEELLRTAKDTEAFYVAYCMPRKIDLNLAYARTSTRWEDLKVILLTLFPRLPLRLQAEVEGLPSPPVLPAAEAQSDHPST